MIQRSFLLIIIFISCFSLDIKAKNKTNPLLNNIPAEGVSFLFYYNTEKIEDHHLVEELFDSKVIDLFEKSKEACIYAHDLEKNSHITFNIHFKLQDGITVDDMNKIIENSSLSITGFNENFIDLKEEGDETKYGFLHKKEDYYVLKVYFQRGFINKEYSEIVHQLVQKYTSDQISYSEYVDQVDSLKVLDSPATVPYFEKIIAKDKEDILNNVALKKTLKMPEDIASLPMSMYLEQQNVNTLGRLIGYNKSIWREFLRRTDELELFEQMHQLSMYENVWYGVQLNKYYVNAVSYLTTGYTSENTKLDKDIIQYIPKETTSIFSYSTDMEKIREQVINNYQASGYNSDSKEIKLMLLAVDDDFLNIFQSGFISFNMDKNASSKDLDFKAAFKMPNEKKGRLLLRMLATDLEFLKETDDANTFLITHRDFDDVPTHLVIENDVWIIGTGHPKALKYKNKEVYKQYPEMSKKVALVANIQSELFGRHSEVEKATAISEYINKRQMKSSITIKFKKEEYK